MRKHTLFLGLNDKDSKVQEVKTEQAVSLIGKIAGDCTITPSTGYYTHQDGTIVKETSLKVEMLFKADNQVLGIVQDLKTMLNQESIAVQTEEINSFLM